MLKSLMAIRQKMHVYGSHLPCVTIPVNLKTNTTDIILIASIARCELNSRGDEINIYYQYQPEMDSKFRHRMDNRSELQEIASLKITPKKLERKPYSFFT